MKQRCGASNRSATDGPQPVVGTGLAAVPLFWSPVHQLVFTWLVAVGLNHVCRISGRCNTC
jgi:hypothetical protein